MENCLSKQNVQIAGKSDLESFSDLLKRKMPVDNCHDYVKNSKIICDTLKPNVYKYSTNYRSRKERKIPNQWRPLDQNGKLIFPPIQCIREYEEKMKQKLERKAKYLELMTDNSITLQELAVERTVKKSKSKRRVKKESDDPRIFQEEVNR